jgi:hypothetical protein
MENQTTQNPVQEPVPNPVSTSIPIKNNNLLTLVFSVFLLLLLASTGYLYYQNQQLKRMLANYQTPVASPTPTATANPTTNWKTYTNPDGTSSFKYPSDWSYQSSSEGCGPVFYPPNTKNTWLTVCGINSSETAKQMAESSIGPNSSSKLISEKNIVIDSKNGIEQVISVPTREQDIFVFIDNVDSKYEGRGTLQVYLYNQDLTQTQKYNELFNQILSTFKFTNDNQIKTDCTNSRSQVCPMDCIQGPPYICGSDDKSYCNTCVACSNENVTWYKMSTTPCGQ